jgi:YD repeat-containing protein
VGVTHDTITTQYTFDPSGNRTDSGAQDRLLQLNGISYTYDADSSECES